MTYSTDFFPYFQTNVSAAFRELLSDKHLYQSTRVNIEFIDGVAHALHEEAKLRASAPRMIGDSSPHVPNWEIFRKDGLSLMSNLWIPDAAIVYPANSWQELAKSGHIDKSIKVILPTIQTRCPHCKGRWPFNPMEANGKWEQGRRALTDQWFFISYECQSCKGEPIRFLIRRTGNKLTLCGRDPIEAVEVPPVIPKGQAERYSSSIVAYQSGQSLAAVFLLRVFVEQYWRSIDAVVEAIKDKQRPTGDEIGQAYKATLPADFSGRFPSLCEVYNDLSAAIHAADDSPEIYPKACEMVIEHFEARRLFRLDNA